MCRASETPFERIESAIRELPGWLAGQSGSELGAAIIKGREVGDRVEAVNGEATRNMDPAHVASVTRDFEHRVDAEAALNQANRAHQRRYLQIGEAINGPVRIEGQVTPDAGAIIRTAIEPYARPPKGDDRSAG